MEIPGAIGAIVQAKRSELFSLAPDDSVLEAILLMNAHNIGAVLVMEHSRLAGIFTERDYTRKIVIHGKTSRDTPLRDVMSPPVTVSPTDSVASCMERMTNERVRHLPVVEAGQVIGLVSIGDLVKWVISAQDAAIQQLESYVLGNGR